MIIDVDQILGHCNIFHQDYVPMSDEHVIPKSIGGCYHVFNDIGFVSAKQICN